MPFGGLLTAGIMGGASLVSGLLGSSAASKAAKTQAAMGQAVAGSINTATGGAIQAGYNGMTQANSALNQGLAGAQQWMFSKGNFY